MSKPADNLSDLFRSLGPDDSSFQVTETATAREAAQRWPLFQAISPNKPETTPTLSTQERERWSQQEKQVGAGRKPPLSLPGLSDKLAQSLSRMAGPRPDAPAKPMAKRAQWSTSVPQPQPQRQPQPQPQPQPNLQRQPQPELQPQRQPQPQPNLQRQPQPQPQPQPNLQRQPQPELQPQPQPQLQPQPLPPPRVMPLVSEASAPLKAVTISRIEPASDPYLRAPSPEHTRESAERVKPVASEPSASTSEPSEAMHKGDSLASIFSRLEKKPETIHKTIEKKSSFLTRLGKR